MAVGSQGLALSHQGFVSPRELLEEGGLQKSQPLERPLPTLSQQGRGRGEENQLPELWKQLFGAGLAWMSPLFHWPPACSHGEGAGRGRAGHPWP